jgi:DNA-binding CsgD family transcriptional regulator
LRLQEPVPALFSAQAWAEIAQSLNLSGRELEIIHGVFNDCTESAIAADLGISPHTVHTHLNRLHRKLAVVDRLQLVTRIVREFLALTLLKKSMQPICAIHASGQCPVRCR